VAQPNIRVLERFYEAYNARDIERILALMHPEIRFESRFAQMGGAVYHGHDGVRGWLDDLADAWDYLDVDLQEATETEPDHVVALIRLHGRGRASGLDIDEQLAHVLDFRGGLVARLAYTDRTQAERVVGGGTRPGIAVATFDCYGTLVDWEGGIGAFLYALMLREGVEDPPPGRELRERWEAIQFELIRGPYKPYKEILAEATLAWCREAGVPDDDAYAAAIVGSMRAWQPFPDAYPALTQAREAGVRLVILSNTDRDIIDHTVRQIGVPFDDVVTAEDVGAYKPSLDGFRHVLGRLGEDPADVLHVAFGFKYDIGPAKELGMRSAWVNRRAEPLPDPGTVPDHEWRDLWGLAELSSS
jgi:2-haloalkanoic acid dehalogenase type II